MRESQRKVQECLESLGDAEILLDRAVRLCKQQAELLPLFSLIAKGVHLPSHCRLNSLLIAMVVLMQGPFEQKYTILFRLFDSTCEGRGGLQFVLSLFSAVQEALYLLKMLASMTTRDELTNTVTRGFMSYHLIPTRDLLTEYELKHLVMSLVSHSAQLTSVLGLSARTSMIPGKHCVCFWMCFICLRHGAEADKHLLPFQLIFFYICTIHLILPLFICHNNTIR